MLAKFLNQAAVNLGGGPPVILILVDACHLHRPQEISRIGPDQLVQERQRFGIHLVAAIQRYQDDLGVDPGPVTFLAYPLQLGETSRAAAAKSCERGQHLDVPG